MNHFVLNLALPTPGDSDFYTRWQKIGEVTNNFENKAYQQKADVLVVDHRVTVSDALLNQLPNVKYICSANTGHTHIQCDYKKRSIELITLKGEQDFLKEVGSVAEFSMHLILALARPSNHVGFLLRGKTLGIVGYGRIGKQVGQIASIGFGMRVLFVDVGSIESDWVKLFSYSDVISLHLPEHIDTIKIIGPKYLNLMQRHAYLINTARGSILDENYLVSMLEQELIAGAALDVVENKNLIGSDVKNLVITDHVAGNTLDDRIRTDDFIVSKLYSKLFKKDMN